jgi:hypothetical protein
MDRDVAEWLAGLITQTVAGREHGAGLTCEVQDDPQRWMQIVPEWDEEEARLDSILLNFAHPHTDEPLAVLARVCLKPPPDTRVETWEAGGYATLWIRPDIPVVALALFAGDIVEKVLEAPPGHELQAWIEYGY